MSCVWVVGGLQSRVMGLVKDSSVGADERPCKMSCAWVVGGLQIRVMGWVKRPVKTRV